MTTISATTWKETGRLHEIGDHRLFAVDTGPDSEAAPVLVVLHGYPTSSYDYAHALPILAERYRVIVHDHLGFGLSDKPQDYSYSLIEQADHAIRLWQELGIERAHVLAHDYGTSVATEILARRNMGIEPVVMQSLTLCNGSMHIELSKLRPIQRMLRNRALGPLVARLSTERVFRRNMRKIVADPACLSDEALGAMWQQLIGNGGRAVLPKITQYLNERYLFWHRWIGALRRTDLVINVLWAREDPVAVEKMAHVLHGEIPNSHLELLDGLGHFPMIEDPERFCRAVMGMLDGLADG